MNDEYKKGDKVAKYDKITGELINGEELEDDLDFDVQSFNKRIIVKSHTVEVLKEMRRYDDARTTIENYRKKFPKGKLSGEISSLETSLPIK